MTQKKVFRPVDSFGNAVEEHVSSGVTFTSDAGFKKTGTGRVEWICTPDKQHIVKAKEQAVTVPDLTATEKDVMSGKTAYSSGGFITGTAEFVSLIFYDWDNSLICSLPVDKTLDEAGVKQEIMDKVVNADAYREIFTSKPGYTFENVWMAYASEAPARYGRIFEAGTNTKNDNYVIEAKDLADYSRIADDGFIALKAAYNGNVNNGLVSSSGAAANRYKTEANRFHRLGTTSLYTVSVKVERKTSDGLPVPRVGNPALRVTTTTDLGDKGYMLISLSLADVAYAEITVPTSIKTVEWDLVDTYQYSNWIGAQSRSATGSVDRDGETGYVYQSNLYYINTELLGGRSANIDLVNIAALGIDTNGKTIPQIRTALENSEKIQNGEPLTANEIALIINSI